MIFHHVGKTYLFQYNNIGSLEPALTLWARICVVNAEQSLGLSDDLGRFGLFYTGTYARLTAGTHRSGATGRRAGRRAEQLTGHLQLAGPLPEPLPGEGPGHARVNQQCPLRLPCSACARLPVSPSPRCPPLTTPPPQWSPLAPDSAFSGTQTARRSCLSAQYGHNNGMNSLTKWNSLNPGGGSNLGRNQNQRSVGSCEEPGAKRKEFPPGTHHSQSRGAIKQLHPIVADCLSAGKTGGCCPLESLGLCLVTRQCDD